MDYRKHKQWGYTYPKLLNSFLISKRKCKIILKEGIMSKLSKNLLNKSILQQLKALLGWKWWSKKTIAIHTAILILDWLRKICQSESRNWIKASCLKKITVHNVILCILQSTKKELIWSKIFWNFLQLNKSIQCEIKMERGFRSMQSSLKTRKSFTWFKKS